MGLKEATVLEARQAHRPTCAKLIPTEALFSRTRRWERLGVPMIPPRHFPLPVPQNLLEAKDVSPTTTRIVYQIRTPMSPRLAILYGYPMVRNRTASRYGTTAPAKATSVAVEMQCALEMTVTVHVCLQQILRRPLPKSLLHKSPHLLLALFVMTKKMHGRLRKALIVPLIRCG